MARVSRAFVKESDGFEADDVPPELRISEHRNLVTARGLQLIEAEVRRLESELAEARSVDDVTHRRAPRPRPALLGGAPSLGRSDSPAAESSIVRFGTAVTLQRNDGTEIDLSHRRRGRSSTSQWPDLIRLPVAPRRCSAGRPAT